MKSRPLIRYPMLRRASIVFAQIVLIAFAYLAAFLFQANLALPAEAWHRFEATMPYLVIVYLACLHRFRLDRGYWRHVGLRDLMNLVAAATAASLVFAAALLALRQGHGIPASVFVLQWLFAIALLGGVRLAVRVVHEFRPPNGTRARRRAFVIGAGEAGEQLLRQLLHAPQYGVEVVGLIDDDENKRDRCLHGVPVLGTAEQLRGLVALHRVSLGLIAIASATTEQLRRLVDRAVDAGVEVKLLPPFEDLVTEDVTVNKLREVRIEDLLSREPVHLDLEAAEDDLAGKVILVTGAAGSIGSELVRQIARFQPLQIVLIDRAESPLYFTYLEVTKSYPAVDVVPVLASVTNASRLQQIFERYRPDCVFHAAAYKHVPILESDVAEGVWNNAIGSLRVARCAARFGAAKFVLISTDKAVNPTSVLGVTKLLAERIVLELPSLRASSTDFRVVRFGNVLGSDGSVVPLFKRQLEAGGPLTVTHREVRRYFMTIPEAVQLVLQAACLPEAAGRIALLEMGTQVRIVDLAEQLIRLAGRIPYQDIDIVFTGLRPGEKLEEELVGPGETTVATSIDKIRLVDRAGAPDKRLARRVRDLTRVAAQRDEQAMIQTLSAILPSYQPTAHLGPRHLVPRASGWGPAMIRSWSLLPAVRAPSGPMTRAPSRNGSRAHAGNGSRVDSGSGSRAHGANGSRGHGVNGAHAPTGNGKHAA